ncbi:cysteine--tRNA ligase [Campylobacterota bacterium]|nr:cysteine--tRNA ligase [Campylobacterota bacterium]
MSFYLFDSHQKRKVAFEPEFPDLVRIYVCGPTVYDDAHLGHARSAISFSLLRRTLLALGYKVQFVRNITDIDDKILAKMAQTKQSLAEITSLYAARYKNDLAALGIMQADVEPKATEHIAQMITLVEQLIANGAAYKTDNGDIYFDVSKDDQYGSLSGETQDEMLSRVESGAKRSSRDFALWKAAKEGESVAFDSPFGRGRPGWHIECSAMVQSHLWREGAEFACDIHAGGSDLFFPHHENEAAQTRCGYHNRIAKYWMHNGFVRVDGQKMSKSLGNSFFVKDALKLFHGEALRFYLMSIHYRAGINYNDGDLFASKKRLDRLYRLKKRLGAEPSAADEPFKAELLEAMSDDLNISKALAVVDEMVSAANESLDRSPKDQVLQAKIAANVAFVNTILGVGAMDSILYFQGGVSDEEREEIEAQIAKRAIAKINRDFANADEIRKGLSERGITLMDLAGRTVWEKE